MGCWSATCGVTQLPINYGDKIRMFVLVDRNRRAYGGGIHYANDIWSPLGVVKGTYDDYGLIENITNDINQKIISEELNNFYIKDNSIYNSLRNIERRKKIFYKTKYQLGIFLVLEDVYQTMINFNPVMSEHNELQQNRLDYIRDSINSFYLRLANPTDISYLDDSLNEIDILNMDHKDYFIPLYRGYLNSLVKNKSHNNEIQELLDSIVELVAFSDSMDELRKFWSPQSGVGSQHNNLELYKEISNTILSIINIRKESNE